MSQSLSTSSSLDDIILLLDSSSDSDLQPATRIAGLGPLEETRARTVLLHLLLAVVGLSSDTGHGAHLLGLPVDHVPPVLLVFDDDVHQLLLFGRRVQVRLRIVVQLRVKRVAQAHSVRGTRRIHTR